MQVQGADPGRFCGRHKGQADEPATPSKKPKAVENSTNAAKEDKILCAGLSFKGTEDEAPCKYRALTPGRFCGRHKGQADEPATPSKKPKAVENSANAAKAVATPPSKGVKAVAVTPDTHHEAVAETPKAAKADAGREQTAEVTPIKGNTAKTDAPKPEWWVWCESPECDGLCGLCRLNNLLQLDMSNISKDDAKDDKKLSKAIETLLDAKVFQPGEKKVANVVRRAESEYVFLDLRFMRSTPIVSLIIQNIHRPALQCRGHQDPTASRNRHGSITGR